MTIKLYSLFEIKKDAPDRNNNLKGYTVYYTHIYIHSRAHTLAPASLYY